MKIKKLLLLLVITSSSLLITEVNGQTKLNTREINDASIIGLSIDSKKAVKESNIPKGASKWIDDELAKVTKKPIIDFNGSNFFNKANGRVIGYIKGYDVSLGFTTGMVYVENDITKEDSPIVIQIHPDGRFEATMPLTMPMHSHLVINNNWIPFYIEPEQTLAMILDWNATKKMDFEGPLAQVNKDLLGYVSPKMDYDVFNNKIKTMSPDEFKMEQLILQKGNLENVTKYCKDNSITPKAAEILKNNILIESATRLLDYVDKRAYEAKNDTLNKILKIPVTNQYYDFLKELPLNQQSILVSKDFGVFVNRFEFSKPLRSNMKPEIRISKPTKDLLEYFEEVGIAVSKEDKDLLTPLKNSLKVSEVFFIENKEKFKAFGEKYKDALKTYSEKYPSQRSEPESYRKDILMANWKIKDSIMTNVLGLEKSLVYDLVKIRSLKFDFTRSTKKEIEPYWESLKKDIANPFLIAEGNGLFNKVFAAEKTAAYPLPPGKATDIFNKIIAPFKGKIVFVDFWATTCGPCVYGIKQMKDIRKKYEGNKDFEFVFITEDAASPMEHYRKFVKEQELNNAFRVLTDDFQYLRELFKFNGIPRYVVIDKNGKVLNDNFAMHNFEAELAGILKASN